MAHFLNDAMSPAASPDVAQLEALLARLRDEWVIVRDRPIPGADGPPVAFVLMHSEVGVALLGLAPAALDEAAAALSYAIAERGLSGVPVVVVSVAAEEIPRVSDRLRRAFESAIACDANDPIWRIKVIDLLLSAADASMRPLVRSFPPAAAASPAGVLSDATEKTGSRFRMTAKATALLCGLFGAAAIFTCVIADQPSQVPSTQAALPPMSAMRVEPARAAAPSGEEPAPTFAAKQAAADPPPTIMPKPSAPPANAAIAPPPHGTAKPIAKRRHRVVVNEVRRGGGNNPREGRYYDEADAWYGPSGRLVPGSPVLHDSGG